MKITLRQLKNIIIKEMKMNIILEDQDAYKKDPIDELIEKFDLPDEKENAIKLAHAAIDVVFGVESGVKAGRDMIDKNPQAKKMLDMFGGLSKDIVGVDVTNPDDIKLALVEAFETNVANHLPEGMLPDDLKDEIAAAANDKEKAKELAAMLIVLGYIIKGPATDKIKQKAKDIYADIKKGNIPSPDDIMKIPLNIQLNPRGN